MNLVDTSGWIEYFFGGANAAYFTRPIEDTAHLIVPVICLYEVFKKANLVANEEWAKRLVVQMKRGLVMTVTQEIALSAALVSLRHRLPMADSMIYATARAQEATLWTQDAHFAGLPSVNYREAEAKTT